MPDAVNSRLMTSAQPIPLTTRQAIAVGVAAIACFHAAYSLSEYVIPQALIVGYVICLVQMARVATARQAFYLGLSVGFLCFAPQLVFFWKLFNIEAAILWLILAVWIALFVSLTQATLARFGTKVAALLVSFIWMGLEYFRSELYYLKFSWLNVSYALIGWDESLLRVFGMYGVGFLAAAIAAAWLVIRSRITAALITLGLLAVLKLAALKSPAPAGTPGIRAAAVQMEFPQEIEIAPALDKLATAHPDADLIVLSEYTLDGPVPESLKAWCRKTKHHLMVGGKDPAKNGNYFDTAFVVSPAGEVVFHQGKSVPIPFFDDGLPASSQAVWESPWGKIGVCVCYDLSYTRVTDELVRQGARILVVPAMDVTGWGEQEHISNGRVAPVRAAEYGIPIVRVGSSGISEVVNGNGRLIATAPFPGQGEMLFAAVELPKGGTRPLDRWLAPFSVLIVALLLLVHLTWRWTFGKSARLASA